MSRAQRQPDALIQTSLGLGYRLAEQAATAMNRLFNDRKPSAAELASIEAQCQFTASLEKLRAVLGPARHTEDVQQALHNIENAYCNDLACYEDRGFYAGFAAARGLSAPGFVVAPSQRDTRSPLRRTRAEGPAVRSAGTSTDHA